MSNHSNSVPVEKLKNIGEKTSVILNEIGVYTKDDLGKLGAVVAYDKIAKYLIKNGCGKHVNLMFLYALQGALMDINCLYLPQEIKDILKRELADLKS